MNKMIQWIKENYFKIINSIAFYPAFIGIIFLISSILLVNFDYSDFGAELKNRFKFLKLEDPDTARSIIAAIASGVISLTVFSFSMVMIVLNQAASQMSNRVLDKLIGNRFQQVVLGIYIGTIVYAFFLLSTISDQKESLYIPSISILILIAITVFDIFLFIYFLHYITQSVKYEVIIKRIFDETEVQLLNICTQKKESESANLSDKNYDLIAATSGIFEGFNESELIKRLQQNKAIIYFDKYLGDFILKGQKIGRITEKLSDTEINKLNEVIYLHSNESIDNNPYFGFRQLTEVSVKALSPGINDPGTAILSLRSLIILLSMRLKFFPRNFINDSDEKVIIYTSEKQFETIFQESILPVWDYGKTDRLLCEELLRCLSQLKLVSEAQCIVDLYSEVSSAIEKEEY